MELTEQQRSQVQASLLFIINQRAARTGVVPEIVEIPVMDDTSKGIVIGVYNAMFNQSARTPDFIAIVNLNQYGRANLLREVLDELTLRDHSKVFFIDELIANPVGNKMVPTHELCTKKMVDELLRRHSILIDSLPKMLSRDPIARWYGWDVGDVVKITRPNGELYYRIVVEKAF